MLDDKLEAAQGFGDVDRMRHEEIVAHSAKSFVLFHLKYDNEITGLGTAGLLIALATIRYLLTVLHAFVDVYFEHLLLLNGLLATALFASVLLVQHLALAAAFTANRLHLLNHTGTKLLVLDCKASTVTRRAGLGGARFAAQT